MKEPNVTDNDQQVRTLFTDAAGHVPPGIDLLHGFSARQAARRVRSRVALATVAASVVAAATAVTITITTAPSALAQLTSAASRTAGLSYHISATVTESPQPDEPAPAQSGRVSGSFDPAQKIGEETIGNDGQIRFIGQYAYLYLPTCPVSGPAIPAGRSWVRLPSPQLWHP
jgi:hypothetical protein